MEKKGRWMFLILTVLLISTFILLTNYRKQIPTRPLYYVPNKEQAAEKVESKSFYWEELEQIADLEYIELKYDELRVVTLDDAPGITFKGERIIRNRVSFTAEPNEFSIFSSVVFWSKNTPNKVYLLNNINDEQYTLDYRPDEAGTTKVITRDAKFSVPIPSDEDAYIFIKEIAYEIGK